MKLRVLTVTNITAITLLETRFKVAMGVLTCLSYLTSWCSQGEGRGSWKENYRRQGLEVQYRNVCTFEVTKLVINVSLNIKCLLF